MAEKGHSDALDAAIHRNIYQSVAATLTGITSAAFQ